MSLVPSAKTVPEQKIWLFTTTTKSNLLSIQVRLNQYLDDLVKQSNVLKKNWDEWPQESSFFAYK